MVENENNQADPVEPEAEKEVATPEATPEGAPAPEAETPAEAA